MIHLKNIEKYYENGIVKTFVLRQINLDIQEGEFVSIMGPSGAGKSTLLHILGMLDTPSGGEYTFYDQPVHQLNER
jgi:putative ABC transport system ATP-binding protein